MMRIQLGLIVTGWLGAATALAGPPATQPAPTASAPARIRGVIPANITRPIAPTTDPKLAALLKPYAEPPGEVVWSMRRLISNAACDVYDLRFPSPVVTATPENNTVCCEYYRCHGDQRRPAVIVLHISDGRFVESRALCSFLAACGIDGLMLKMAYYGPRRPKDAQGMRALTRDLPTMIEAVRQSVMDTRRAARWLAAQPHVDAAQISLLGTSLGGFVGSIASGVDGGFHRSVFLLAGGHLEQILTGPSREVRTARATIAASGLSQQELAQKLIGIEPCTFAGRIDPASVLMINTRDDPVVPAANATALAKAIGDVNIQWYPGDHYAILYKLPEVFLRVNTHLTKSPKPTTTRPELTP